MDSLAKGLMLTAAARRLALACLATPCALNAQPTLGPLADEQRQIVYRIQDEQAQNGPHSPQLIAPLTALSEFYQKSGDHALAAAAAERAAQIVRANYGLRSLEQLPLLRRWIANEEAAGDFATAWDLEQNLWALASDHPDDLRTVPVLREIADKRMALLDRYSSGEIPPQIFLGCFYKPDIGSCYAGSRNVVVRGIVADAWRGYTEAIDVLLHHELYSSVELREIEMTLVRSSHEHGDYAFGRQSLRRLLFYDIASDAPLLSRVEAQVRLTDWDLFHSRSRNGNDAALESYKKAYAQLRDHNIPQAAVEQVFAPEIPVVLPSFVPNPLAPRDRGGRAGHIDVTFVLTKYGKARDIDVIDSTPGVRRAVERRLERLIVSSQFRPRLTREGIPDEAPVTLRYYVDD